jgi:hypothetical protein
MGQSSSGKESARREAVAEEFRSLLELVGDWVVVEEIFREQRGEQRGEHRAESIMNTGRLTCRSVIGGLAIIVITEIEQTLEKTVTLNTFNPRTDRYDLALVDSNSDHGTVPMVGRTLNIRSSEEVRLQFGKAATAVREWRLAEHVAGEQEIIVERIVENKINEDRWVIEFFSTRAQHGEHGERLVRQQVITRVNQDCQPLLGCELGCAALQGCQLGCAGSQVTRTGSRLGCGCGERIACPPGVACPPQVFCPPTFGCPPQTFVPPTFLPPPFGQCLTPPGVCLTPPGVCLTPPGVCLTPPMCPTQPMRPTRPRPERPEHPEPGKPGHK